MEKVGLRGAAVVGVAGLILALAAAVNEADFVGAGLCLLASGLAFGMVGLAEGRPGR